MSAREGVKGLGGVFLPFAYKKREKIKGCIERNDPSSPFTPSRVEDSKVLRRLLKPGVIYGSRSR